MHVAVCDAESDESRLLQNMILQHDASLSVSEFNKIEDLLQTYCRNHFDIVFLDPGIVSPGQCQEAINIVRQYGRPEIIFITTYEDALKFAVKGYRFAIRFLIRPVSCSDLISVLSSAVEAAMPFRLCVPAGNEEVLLHFEEVLYAEVHRHCMTIHTLRGEFIFRGTLKHLAEQIPQKHFAVPYRGFLVNLSAVRRITRTHIIMQDGTKIPLSRKNYNQFYSSLMQYNRSSDEK